MFQHKATLTFYSKEKTNSKPHKFIHSLIFIVISLFSSTVKSSCSSYNGQIVINEYNYITNFVELKILDNNLTTNTTNFDGWTLTLFKKNGNNVVSTVKNINSIYSSSDNSCGTTSTYIEIPFSSNEMDSEVNVVLSDNSGDPSNPDNIVDVFRISADSTVSSYYSGYNSCDISTLPHQTDAPQLNDSGHKDYARIPDGTGDWIISPGTGANSESSLCTSNDGSGGGGGDNVSKFNAFDTETAIGSITGYLKTRIADNNSINFDIVAIDTAGTAIDSTFSADVTVELLETSTPSALDANNCPNSYTVISTATSTISNGRSSISLPSVDNVWKNVSVRISYPLDSPTITSCSNDLFSIRPDSFTLKVSHLDWETAGDIEQLNASTSSTSTPIHKAGKPFRLEILAVDSAGSAVTNYSDTPITDLQLLEPSTGTLGTFNKGSLTISNGQITSDTANYSEVGFITLQFTDTTFTNIDASDGSTSSALTISSPIKNIGRFVPDHFSVISSSITPACTSYSYMDEAFTTSYKIEARNNSENITRNYDFTTAYANATNIEISAEHSSNNLSTRISMLYDSENWVNGEFNIIDGNILFSRINSVDGPYDGLDIGLKVIDSDNVVLNSPDMLALDNTTSAYKIGTTNLRFGRLKINNAYGSEQLDLNIPITMEYFDGNNWITNTDDNCTTLSLAANFSISDINPTDNTDPKYNDCILQSQNSPQDIGPDSGDTSASPSTLSVSSGNSSLILSSPNKGVDGEIYTGFLDVTSTLPIKTWLKYDWDNNGTHDNCPSARATFGIYKGNSKQIYFREVY